MFNSTTFYLNNITPDRVSKSIHVKYAHLLILDLFKVVVLYCITVGYSM